MAEREASEPLLRDEASASPPSPHRTSDADLESDRRWSGGSDGPMSAISAAVRTVQRIGTVPAALPGVTEQQKKIVSVFYWTQYDSGDCCTYIVDVLASHNVRDLMQASITYFALHCSIRDTHPDNYLLRAADKRGQPKTHFPAFGLNQLVIITQITRFSLCSKKLDNEAKLRLEAEDPDAEVSAAFPPINTPAEAPVPQAPAQLPRKCPCKCSLS